MVVIMIQVAYVSEQWKCKRIKIEICPIRPVVSFSELPLQTVYYNTTQALCHDVHAQALK